MIFLFTKKLKSVLEGKKRRPRVCIVTKSKWNVFENFRILHVIIHF